MKSVMQHSFALSPQIHTQRSVFNRSHGHKTTFYAAQLIPIYVDEALPGDTFNLNASMVCRLSSPLLHPIMDNIFLDVHFFSVPMRQVWENFRKFMGEQENPTDSIDYTIPMNTCEVTEGDFEDYLGWPYKQSPNEFSVSGSELYWRAYAHIFNEWYRDENQYPSITFNKDDSVDDFSHLVLNRAKRHDYFTSCLPWPQKFDTVTVPYTGIIDVDPSTGSAFPIFASANWDQTTTLGIDPSLNVAGSIGTVTSTAPLSWSDPNLEVDLSAGVGTAINEIRDSLAIQHFLERDARGGTRYAELVKSHFGVDFPDLAYRPEYLGGGTISINTPQVASTFTTATAATGELGAYGIGNGSGIGFTKSFNEHCIVFGICSSRADLTYSQGLPRMYSRETRYDFFWPDFAHLGEQAVLNKELYMDGTPDDDLVFGYQERYGEYRYKNSLITGLFRPDATQTLNSWHLSQTFVDHPVMGINWIDEQPPMNRVLVYGDQPDFILDSYFDLRCARPMPLNGTPGLMRF